jgi:putative ABC transport system permease protein
MLHNYFLLAWRHLTKKKVYSVINIVGLSTGMAIALLIGLWIYDELSFDHYFPNHKRLAILMEADTAQGMHYRGSTIMVPLGAALRNNYPGLFSRTALYSDGSNHLYSFGNTTVSGPGIWSQPELPAMFGFKMVAGTVESVKDPSTALIDQSLANALFGSGDPIGKTIKVDNEIPLKVGGVYQDLPRNTSFQSSTAPTHSIQVIMPWYNKTNSYFNNNTDWQDHNSILYVELAPGVTAEQATGRIKNIATSYFKSWHEELMIDPLDRAYLHDQIDPSTGKESGGHITYVWLFGIIGIFTLILACINFMNLATARSETRAREVGIRKTIGSHRWQLIGQFFSESILVAGIAFILALFLASVTLPFFNNIADKQMAMPWTSALFWTMAISFVGLTGLLAGSYPAFYLSAFRPVQVLKSRVVTGRWASLPRRALVVLQFTVSLTLIICTSIVYRQILYTEDRPVGYSRSGLITLDINTPDLGNHRDAIRTALLQKNLASNVAFSNMSLTDFNDGNGLDWPGKTPDQNTIMFRNVNISPDYGRTIGWAITQGRDLSPDMATDSAGMIINAAAAKAIGIRNIVGTNVKFFGMPYHIVGVSADMVNVSPSDTIEPAIFLGGRYTGKYIIRINPRLSAHTALSGMETIFKTFNPAGLFIYHFVDDDYSAKFKSAENIGNLAAIFTALAIFISCLGLFGLASFIAERRTKEIGIRKVLGARVANLWGMLSKDFLLLVSLSFIIAIPLSAWGMEKLLHQYTYRADLSWWIFAAACVGILLITLATVSYQALRAALANPTKSLRTE